MPQAVVRVMPSLVFTALVACGKSAPIVVRAADSTPAPAVTVLPSNVATRILTEVGDSASRIEGIAAFGGLLYVADFKDGVVYRIDPAAPTPVRVGGLPTKAGESIFGLATDAKGNLYAAVPGAGVVYRIAASRLGAKDFDTAKDATAFATGVKGANGITVAPDGHVWVSGGDAGVLYHVPPEGGVGVVFAKDYAKVSADTTMPVRAFVTNGAAVDSKGFVYTANTGTGAISKLEVKPDHTVGAITTLVTDPRLLGADGLLVGAGDTLWVIANIRNTLAKVAPDGAVSLVTMDATPGGALRFPAELKRIGTTVYVANLNYPIGSNTGSAPGATVAAVEVN